jgi:hypothetical protein
MAPIVETASDGLWGRCDVITGVDVSEMTILKEGPPSFGYRVPVCAPANHCGDNNLLQVI